MRIYIPTSSINADSILSCECVAPASVCRARNFGYQHFELLPELRHYDNVILAFSKVPVFFINDQVRENYPMVVEIEVNEVEFEKFGIVKHVNVDDIEIYATANPILFTPTNARLLFFKREHLDYTFHNCSDSAKCKLFDFFKKRFSFVPREVIGKNLEDYVTAIQMPHLTPTYSENDYNRVKGFIWGFGLGAFASMTPDIAGLLKIQKRIYDIISSTKNDEYIPQRLKDELNSLDKEYTKLDPEQAKAKKIWSEYLKNLCEGIGIKADDLPTMINKLLVSLKVENEAKVKFIEENNILLRKTLSSYPMVGSYGYEQYCADLERHTQSVIYRNRQECLNSHTFDILDIDTAKFETVVLSGDDKDCTLFNRFLFKVIWNNLIPSLEDLRVNRSENAKQVVIALKSIIEGIGDTWTETPIQAYFDRMRKNISKYDPFNPTDEDSPVLQSISSFVLKGEDFESLKSYLETNAISDYRYAFALWGAMTGYVSIPRTIIESILKTKANIATLYNIVEVSLDKIEPKVSFEAPTNEPPIRKPVTVPSEPSNCANQAAEFRQKVLRFFNSTIVKGQKKDRQELLRIGLIRAFEEFGEDSNPIKFVSLLNDFVDFGWKSTLKPWKTLRDYIAPNYDAQISRRSSNKGGHAEIERTSHQTELPFGDDKGNPQLRTNTPSVLGHIWKGVKDFVSGIKEEDIANTPIKIRFCGQNILKIRDIIAQINPGLDDFALSQIEKDLTWIFDPKYSVGKSENELLKLFKSILISGKTEKISKNGKSMDWKNRAYLPLDIDITIDYLRKISGNCS